MVGDNHQIKFLKQGFQAVKEGSTVLYVENKGKYTETTVPAIITNIKEDINGDEIDYTFNLIDANSGQFYAKSSGEKRVWKLRKVLALGIIKLLDENLLSCPDCGRKILEEGNDICYDCKLKRKKNFFDNKVVLDGKPFYLDNEQVETLLSDTCTLVTARAGSGKTRVLTAKLIDLFFNQGVREDEVIAFCFNKDAANEIRRRINSEFYVDGILCDNTYDVVHTFHSFAKMVLGNECGQVLVDENCPERTRLIKQIITELRTKNPKFEEQLRKHFLKNTLKIDRKRFISMDSYYRFVRNSRYRTLKGEHVKSVAEKIIADFLCEHNIKYKYERRFFLNKVDSSNHKLTPEELKQYKSSLGSKRETIPDFYLEDYNFVWEHWGITGNETNEQKEEFSKAVCSYSEYYNTMSWKRSFWKYWRYKINPPRRYKNDFKTVKGLIETNPEIFAGERDAAELAIKGILESYGIKCVKLPEDVIMREVWKNAEDYFTKQIKQFIDKFQQIYFDNERVFLEKAKIVGEESEKTFLRLGYLVYQKYIQILAGDNKNYPDFSQYHIDFNQCLHKAAKKIQSGEFDYCLKKLKWILIDEYQDFSELFHNLIKSIITRNPNIKLFCVGDDWQAINRFAGADLKFFLGFSEYFSNSVTYNVRTNYRSENHIVSKAGDFMKRFRIEGKPQRGLLENSGVFKEITINKVYFNSHIDKFEWLVKEGGPWADCDNMGDRNIQAYIQACSEIINDNPEKKIMILNRRNSFLGKDLDEIERILKHPRLCKIENPNITVKTVHRAKGEEADIVILTEVNENCFPVFHTDSNLFRIFGEDENTIMQDEMRLYYVALTRAKQSIYIFYSSDEPSMFIENP